MDSKFDGEDSFLDIPPSFPITGSEGRIAKIANPKLGDDLTINLKDSLNETDNSNISRS